jgi:arabinan endo-1,5-alpha-L-arabinosidase
MNTLSRLLAAALLLTATGAAAQQPAQQRRQQQQRPSQLPLKDVNTHDPVMAKEGDTYYLFSTGMRISVMSSKDMQTWKFEKPVFDEVPEWTKEAVIGFRGHMWAPDIIFHNGLWHIFYSCSAFAKNTSAIGHATTPTLNPSSPDYKWTDRGMIVQSVPNRDMWNAIDPNVIVDDEGTPWMDFGSFWDGIKMVKLTNDMMSVAHPEEWHSLMRRERTFTLDDTDPGDGAVEAPFIIKHGKYYYQFVSWDYCCRGLKSDYKVVVGRSETVVGPYLDKEGKRMDKGGGSLVVEGNKEWAGIGHNAAYHFDGKDYFIAHAYSIAEDGASKLIIREMTWTADGWPIVKL